MPADLLAVEVTEGVFDEADPQVLATVGGLRDLGILITMDDFGAGFSSLRRLAELPIDVLKIDGTLVQSIKPNSDEAPILQAILTMARSLGMKVVAERVETAHQASVLRGMGYDFVQGYLYGKPSPALASTTRWSIRHSPSPTRPAYRAPVWQGPSPGDDGVKGWRRGRARTDHVTKLG